eukprot:6675314-Prymnesium_polylepis.1
MTVGTLTVAAQRTCSTTSRGTAARESALQPHNGPRVRVRLRVRYGRRSRSSSACPRSTMRTTTSR